MALPSAFLRPLIIAAFAAVLALAPAHARQITIVTTTTVTWTAIDAGDDEIGYIEEDAALLDDEALAEDEAFAATRRYAPAATLATLGQAKARFGPFSVIDAATVRMAGDVTSATPRQFAAMLAAFPRLRRIEMVDCPGSLDDDANLALARAIRRAGLETVVPSGGSVRSGAVELWLAGATRRAAPDAEFGVHSWADEYGHEANDYPADDPVHADYIGLYRELGMDAAKAREFYALTNATPFDEVRYLTRADMARFVALD